MTIFYDFEAAREFAKTRLEELEEGEYIYIMRKDGVFLVTGDYKGTRRKGWQLWATMSN